MAKEEDEVYDTQKYEYLTDSQAAWARELVCPYHRKECKEINEKVIEALCCGAIFVIEPGL